MPKVTYMGPYFACIKRDKSAGEWMRGVPEEVSQEWVNANRRELSGNFRVEGDEGITTDELNDGIPDKGWTIKDIRAWLNKHDANPSGYATKTSLLKSVDKVLNPPQPEIEQAAEEQAVEENKGDE